MQKQNLEKFVGIPYKFLGTDYTGLDCIGLCQLFYFEHGIPLEFRDGREILKDWYLTEPFRLARWLVTNFDRIRNRNDLEYGDIILFEINGEGHTGIYLGDAKVLTILEFFKKSMIIHLKRGNVLYRGGFRKRVNA